MNQQQQASNEAFAPKRSLSGREIVYVLRLFLMPAMCTARSDDHANGLIML
jgi:hypothetical protein